MPVGIVCSPHATSPVPPTSSIVPTIDGVADLATRVGRRDPAAVPGDDEERQDQARRHEPEHAHHEHRHGVHGDLHAEVGRAPHDVEHEHADPDGDRAGGRAGHARWLLGAGRAPECTGEGELALVRLGQVAGRWRAPRGRVRRPPRRPSGGTPCTAGSPSPARPAASGTRPGSGPGPGGRGGTSASTTICVVVEPVSRSPRRAASSSASGSSPSAARIVRLLPGPPRLYWPIVPSVRTTRWHGTMSGTGLCPSAVPTARTAFGRPISAAIQPYGRTSPRGISSAFVQTATSNSRPAAEVERDADPASPRRAGAPIGGPRGARAARRRAIVRRPVRASWRATASAPSPACSTSDDAAAVPGDPQRPERGVDRAPCGRRGRPRRARRSRDVDRRRRRRGRRGGRRARRRSGRGNGCRAHAVSSSSSFAGHGGAEHREATVDLGLEGALGSAEDLGELGVGQVVDVTQHHRDAVPLGEGGEERGEALAVGDRRRRRAPGRWRRSRRARARPRRAARAGVVGTGWRRARLRHRLTTIVASQARSRSSRMRCGS